MAQEAEDAPQHGVAPRRDLQRQKNQHAPFVAEQGEDFAHGILAPGAVALHRCGQVPAIRRARRVDLGAGALLQGL